MRRAEFFFSFVVILATACLCPLALPAAWAADSAGSKSAVSTAAEAEAPAVAAPHDAATAGESPPDGTSPWEHPLWHNATTMMRIYVCQHARRPPSWCEEPSELPANMAVPEIQGPPLSEEDALWLAFMDRLNPAELSPDDVAKVRRRAIQRRDPQAMEMLGYIYAEGLAVQRDYSEAYRWYGMAYLAGERRVRANMDVVWQQLQRYDVESALALTREFNALARGDVPPNMKSAPGKEFLGP